MTNLISAEGMQKLKNEYHHLWTEVRPKIVQGVADAAAEGDRSENAEYIYGKRKLAEIDRKLKHLGKRLKVLKIAAPPVNPVKVSFGCWITYEEETGEERCYQLVGSEEIDVSQGKISIDSPIGQALLGKEVDDEVTLNKPSGIITAYITGIYSTRPQL